MQYPDKFHLTSEQSLFLAKKRWDENVYCGMKMEARAVTFPQTKTILQGVNVPNVALDDIQAILNMRDAWRFLLGSVNEELNLSYICKLNEYIARNDQGATLDSESRFVSAPPLVSDLSNILRRRIL